MAKKPWALMLCLSDTNVLHRGETVWKMMSIQVGQERSELNSRSKKLQHWLTNRSQMVDELAAAAGISHDTCPKILSDDLNMSRVTEHSVPRVLTREQRDDRMCICVTWSIVLYQRWRTCIAGPTATVLRANVDMCKRSWVFCNIVRQNHSLRNYFL
jgi:hypothetical protein